MAKSNTEKGKVYEFKPRKHKKLKTLDYVDPEQRELRRMREEQRKKAAVRKKVIRYTAYFLLLCTAATIIKAFI